MTWHDLGLGSSKPKRKKAAKKKPGTKKAKRKTTKKKAKTAKKTTRKKTTRKKATKKKVKRKTAKKPATRKKATRKKATKKKGRKVIPAPCPECEGVVHLATPDKLEHYNWCSKSKLGKARKKRPQATKIPGAGLTAGDLAEAIEASAGAGGAWSPEGVVVECVRAKGKIKVRPAAGQGYDTSLFIQFPRDKRHDGCRYVVDALDHKGTHYRAVGEIRPF